MEVVRWRIDPTGSPVLEKFIGTDSATALEVYEHRAPLLYALDNITEISDEELRASERRRLEQVLGRAVTILKVESEPAFLPPMHPTDETWLTTSAMLSGMIHGDGHGHDWSRHLGILGAWQAVFDAGTDEAALLSAAQAVHDQSAGLAAERGEYRKIASEDSYYRQDLLYKALLLFVLAFVLTAMLWLRPSSKILAGSVWTSSALAVVLVIAAITWRCILRERPPVSTLYETVLFITGSIGLLGLIIEAIVRNRVALSLVSLLGAMGLFLAMRYETTEAVDTMPQLIAVLDTNFWLATHVTTVTLGYAAGLLAGAIAIVYLGGRLIGFRRDDKQLYRSIAQLVYGVTCFGLVFAVVGTILGGIWANESWGRFWGWDPKENGALLIVLAQLAILHARMAGWIRAYGLCLAAVLTIGVVVFSWWHVNQLGAGLHSYGHTDGVMQAILIAYSVVLVMFGLGLLARFRDLKRARVSAELGELD
jgi:ABC-type transport system involved in cytochrome c biogenesis permease subunit